MLRFVFIALMLLGMSACSLIPKPDLNITSAQVNPMSEVMKGLQNQPGPKFRSQLRYIHSETKQGNISPRLT